MKTILLVLACLVSVPFAQSRTWGFSRDTVYHRNYGAEDTLRIVNSGVDTLRFDSVHLELVRPTAVHYEVIFYQATYSGFTNPYFVAYDSGVMENAPSWYSAQNPRSIVVKAQDTAKFAGFKLGLHPLIVSKRAAIEPGDTLIVRMIFIAAGGRGRDTLVVVGREDIPMGLQPAIPGRLEKSKSNLRFDPLGRRVDEVPEARRILATPLLKPKKSRD
jgi:hypothetical protein